MRRGKYLFVLVIVSIVLAGVLFGSPLGVFGWLQNLISLEFKTTAILALSIFGFYCFCAFLWLGIAGKKLQEYEVGTLVFAVIIGLLNSVAFANFYQDCSIFKFCSNPSPIYCPKDDCR